MEILLTNDDGIQARGLEILASEMEKLGHVTIVAPDGPRSGNSNAVTMGLPIRIRQVSDTVTRSTYVSNGTPSDCVKLGLEVIYKDRRPDILIAGINHGSNAAVNVIYSGTMGAVFVGNEQGVPSIGFSLDDHRPDADFSFMQPYLIPLVKLLADKGTDACWNINAPKGGIKGWQFARQCHGLWVEDVVEQTDPLGNKGYWLAGYFKNTEPEATDTDLYAMEHGYIAICPMTVDMTCHAKLQQCKKLS